jgi:hypothetical protein
MSRACSLVPALFAVAVPFVALGCSLPVEDASASSAAETTATGSQTFPSTPDAIAQTLSKWRTNNPGTWTVTEPAFDVDPYGPYVRAIWRTDPVGAPHEISSDEAIEKAIDLLIANSDLLEPGLSSGQVYGLEETAAAARPEPGNPNYEHYQWFVTFHGNYSQRGYEAFPSVAQKIHLQVGFDTDGEIHAVLQGDTVEYPKLSLSTTPGIPSTDRASMMAHVTGTPLDAYTFVRMEGFRPVYKKTPRGSASLADVTDAKLTIFLKQNDTFTAETFSLAYELTVTKTDTFKFVVDATTSEVLSHPEAPFGKIIQ